MCRKRKALLHWLNGYINTMDNTFLQDQKAVLQAQIVAYQAAATSLASGAIESYMLDTGQTIQKVTKVNIKTLQNVIDSLYNRYATLCARLKGATVLVRPSW